jgi:thiamine-monophosphate kinase
MKVSSLGERGVIELIWSILRQGGSIDPSKLELPPSDDASALKLEDGRFLVLKTDMFVKRTDAPRGMRTRQMGVKAVTMNISDLAAKGARPAAFLFSLGLPKNYLKEKVQDLIEGINSACTTYSSPVLGGDVGEAREMLVAGFAVGFAKNLVKRSGASPGDIVAVTGEFGNTGAAYKILLEGMDAPRRLRRHICSSIYVPKAQLRVGIALAESGAASSSMDSSDGLAFTLNELARASGVGFAIRDLPISKNAMEFSTLNKVPADDLALYGGEEYEIIYSIKKEKWDLALKTAHEVGGKLVRIGEVVPSRKVVLARGSEEVVIPSKGWEHLR